MSDKNVLKPLNSVIQICPICGKVDVYKNDGHDCSVNTEENKVRDSVKGYFEKMTEKLKLCPFCGGKAEIIDCWIRCSNCFIVTDIPQEHDIEEAIKAWNRRMSDGQ